MVGLRQSRMKNRKATIEDGRDIFSRRFLFDLTLECSHWPKLDDLLILGLAGWLLWKENKNCALHLT